MRQGERRVQIVAMMPRASKDAIRSSTAVLRGGIERADATYQSSVAIVTTGGELRSDLLQGSKRKVAADACEKLPKAGRGARDDGVDGLVCRRLVAGLLRWVRVPVPTPTPGW